MKGMTLAILAVVLSVVVAGVSVRTVAAEDVPRITKEELKSMLGNPDVIVLDVRAESDWKDSDQKIQGAVREDPKDVKSWVDKYSKAKTLILYCA